MRIYPQVIFRPERRKLAYLYLLCALHRADTFNPPSVRGEVISPILRMEKTKAQR